MKIALDEAEQTSPDLTPMIDCVFLLLIFFLVATTMKKPEEELKVQLPDPAISARVAEEAPLVVIGIDETGLFYVGTTPVGQGELRQRLHDIAQRNPDARIRIDVDRRAPSRSLVHLLDLCAFEKLRHYAIHTQSKVRYER